MTDKEIKRLEELARRAAYSRHAYEDFMGAVEPSDVLALIERVRKAEDALDVMCVDLAAARETAEKNGAAYFAALEEKRKAEAKVGALRNKGGVLGNCAFNLKQMDYVPEDVRKSLEAAQVAWDAAVRETP